MGDVYLVRDTVINRRVALKTIRLDADLDPKQVIELRQRFYREGQTAGQLTHPNIVTVYDVGEDLGMSYIVMEFVEGQTLTQWMKKQRFTVAADQARGPRRGAWRSSTRTRTVSSTATSSPTTSCSARPGS